LKLLSGANIAVRDMIVTRLARRLFDSFFAGITCSTGSDDRTRRCNLFKNYFVLAAGALIHGSFSYLGSYQLLAQENVALLEAKAGETLLYMHKVIEPSFFASKASETTIGFARYVPQQQQTSQSPEDTHNLQVQAYRSNVKVTMAYGSFILNIYSKPLEFRTNMLQSLVEVAREEGTPSWILKIIRMVSAYPMTTVDCERDFSWMQNILDEHRLRMSDEMVAAYVLAKKAPEYMKIRPSGKTLSEHKDAMQMLMKNGATIRNSGSSSRKKTKLNQSSEASKQTKSHAPKTSTVASSSSPLPIDISGEDDEQSPTEPIPTAQNDESVAENEVEVLPNSGIDELNSSNADKVAETVIQEVEEPRRSKRTRRVNPRYATFFVTEISRSETTYMTRDELIQEHLDFEGALPQDADDCEADKVDYDDCFDEEEA